MEIKGDKGIWKGDYGRLRNMGGGLRKIKEYGREIKES